MRERFSYLDQHAQAYLKRCGKTLYCRSIDENSVGFESMAKCPVGSWQKASDTAVLLDVFEDFCKTHASLAASDEILKWTFTAAANVNVSIRTLYKGGLWLDRCHGQMASISGLNFLKSYGHLVALTLRANRDRFAITPKFHFLHHLFLRLKEESSKLDWSLNMIGTSVQMDEEH